MAAADLTRPAPWDLLAAAEAQYADLGALPADIAAFGRTPAVQRLLGVVAAPGLVEREPQAAAEYLHLLFADWQHWRHGRPVHAVERDSLEARLSRSAPPGPRPPVTYVQFPPRWMWMQPGAGPHEPLDGCYVIPTPREELLMVAVLGLLEARGGWSQVTVTARVPDLAAAGDALPPEAFAPAMPGGAGAGLHSLRSVAELLHLVRLALAVIGA